MDLERLNERMAAQMKSMDESMSGAVAKSEETAAAFNRRFAEKLPGEDKVDRSTMTHIRARIGGRDMLFQMTPDDVPAFEQMYGSAFGFYGRLREGNWTVADLAALLNFASMSDKDRATVAKSARYGMAASSMAKANAHVSHVLASRPVAIYSGLARLILASAIFGIDDADAHFTDEE